MSSLEAAAEMRRNGDQQVEGTGPWPRRAVPQSQGHRACQGHGQVRPAAMLERQHCRTYRVPAVGEGRDHGLKPGRPTTARGAGLPPCEPWRERTRTPTAAGPIQPGGQRMLRAPAPVPRSTSAPAFPRGPPGPAATGPGASLVLVLVLALRPRLLQPHLLLRPAPSALRRRRPAEPATDRPHEAGDVTQGKADQSKADAPRAPAQATSNWASNWASNGASGQPRRQAAPGSTPPSNRTLMTQTALPSSSSREDGRGVQR